MKKNILRMCLSLVLAFLLIPLVGVRAQAADYDVAVGSDVWLVVYEERNGVFIDAVYTAEGELPPGIYAGMNENAVIVHGNPTVPGSYRFTLEVQIGGSMGMIDISMVVRSADVQLSGWSKSCKVGDQIHVEFDGLSTGGEITGHSCTGTVPPGLSAKYYDSSIVLTGTCETAGTYNFSLKAYDEASQGWRIQPVTVTVTEAASPTTPTAPPTEAPTEPAPTKPTVTKHPTGESFYEGDSAIFISRADNAVSIVWRLVSPDGKIAHDCKDAPTYFPGLKATGLGTDTLTLSGIPLELNGWKVEAKFIGTAGEARSNGALLTVWKAPPDVPTIDRQPVDAEMEEGEKITLFAGASSRDGHKIRYQWYSNTEASSVGGKFISGADDSYYEPPYQEGVVYYYCVISCVDGDSVSNTVKTRCAEVTGLVKEDPTEPPTTEATEPPTTEATEPETTLPEPEEEPQEEKRGMPVFLVVLMGIVGVGALIACTALTTIYILKNREE